MPILVNEKTNTFHLKTNNTSYIFMIHHGRYPVHLHYGKPLKSIGDLHSAIDFTTRASFAPEQAAYQHLDGSTGLNTGCLEALPLEYAFYGHPDMRTPTFHAQYENGSTITAAEYTGFRVYAGKKPLKGLPATYTESDSEADTLELDFKDPVTGLVITLQYSVFTDYDAITRSVYVQNTGSGVINIQSILSACVDFYGKDYDLTHLDGSWARERHIHTQRVTNGFQGIDSKRGASSHVHNPFIALSAAGAGENHGDVYGFSFVYSGNFIAEAYVDQSDITRVMMGLNPFDFNWRLEAGEDFQAPEVVMVYSDQGFGNMSRLYHRLYRKRLCRGKFRDAGRPVLLNNWEATYFNFNEDKIVEIAKTAQSVGVDLMVLDDGWFGKRNADTCSLGDWVPDKNKLPNGIAGLAEKIHALGMRFGLWFEPEMVSPDSDLFRAHPDWCLHVEGRPMSLGRHQLILDLSRQDVCDYIIHSLSDILSQASIDYVKWDMNRNMSEIGSALLPDNRQRETAHRYMLGLYRVMETLTAQFPDVLFEGCSGGGGRFDPGMLYYTPQIWTSDDSDAIERLFIQYGTSLVYPAGAMGAHVSAVPNHQVHRVTPLSTRGNVAMTGQFGYELDLGLLTPEERAQVAEQIQTYKTIRDVIHNGDLYRLRSPFICNHMALEFVSEDKNTVIFCYYTILAKPNTVVDQIRLEGLDPDGVYVLEGDGTEFGGDRLMHLGLNLKDTEDFSSKIYIFHKK